MDSTGGHHSRQLLLAAGLLVATHGLAAVAPPGHGGWLPGRLSLRFLVDPAPGLVEGRLDLGPAFREVLAMVPEARLEPLF